MALSDRYKKTAETLVSEREKLAVQRAQQSVARLMESDQFKLSALALPEASMAVDSIVSTSVKSALDPQSQYLDTLHVKGFRKADIHQITRRLYMSYCLPLDSKEDELPDYDIMLEEVANYVLGHQEIYNTLNPEDLRNA